jgi:hypothetical protein
MTDNALAKKLKLKPGQRAALINAPAGYVDSLRPLPERIELADQLDGQFDWVQVFLKTQAELETLFPRLIQALKPQSMLWFTFPKGTSKIQTDLTRDKGWDAVQGADLKWINLISVDETWSAFAVRPYKPGEARQSFR